MTLFFDNLHIEENTKVYIILVLLSERTIAIFLIVVKMPLLLHVEDVQPP